TGEVLGQRTPGQPIDLERANHALQILRLDAGAGRRIHPLEHPMKTLGSAALRGARRAPAQRRVASGARENPSRERTIVEARPPDEYRKPAFPRDVANDGGR